MRSPAGLGGSADVGLLVAFELMAGIRAILFDLGETLVDFGPLDTRGLFARGARLAYRYLQQLGHELPPFRVYHRRQLRAVRWNYLKSRITRREFNALDVLGASVGKGGYRLTPEQTIELAWRFYEPLSRCGRIEEGLPELLEAFRAGGLVLGVVSNTFVPGEVLDRHLGSLGLLGYFPVRVYSCDVRYRKPHPRIFQIALDALGASAAEAMFVGDNLKADIAGALRVGMVAVLKDPTGARRHRRIRPTHRITALRELPALVAEYNRQ